MNDIEARLAKWLAHLPPLGSRSNPDQEFEWLISDALDEIRKLRAQVRMNPPTVEQELSARNA